MNQEARISQSEREKQHSTPVVVIAFYKFIALPHYEAVRTTMYAACRQHQIRGTILLATEGINGMLAGSRENIDWIQQHIRSYPEFFDQEFKESYCDEMPFKRIRVRLKQELITLGDPTVDPRERVGAYVDPKDWNALITDPEVLLVDTRNDYEVNLGTFERAKDPNIASFREFPEYVRKNINPKKHRKVAMFCTGGIRCEKATAFMLREGFEEVYHLRGGIIKYLEEVPAEQSLWKGECYVFDDRVSVDHNLKPGTYKACHGCGKPLAEQDMQSVLYEPGVTCPRCYHLLTDAQKESFRERMFQVELARSRNETHIGEG